MKSIYRLLFIPSIFLCSCEIDDPTAFSPNDSYIYFDMPFKFDSSGKPIERLDTIEYSFALEDIDINSYTFKIPVNVAGFPFNSDRTYDVVLDEKSSNVTDGDWERASIENPVIKSGKVFDTLYVKVKRSEILKNEKKTISLYLNSNENFELGDTTQLKANLKFSDMLLLPKWWNPNEKGNYAKYFGEFCREKYVKWQEIYYYGADRNKDSNGKLYYWDYMPSQAIPSWYPMTFMYMRILRDYFNENEVYPNGDRTKPRISLPDNF